MVRMTCSRPVVLGLAAALLALAPSGRARGQILNLGHAVGDRVEEWTGLEADAPPPTTIHELACLIDRLDKKLYCYGKIAVQSPSVFGQNRMTGYRRDYEKQMGLQLSKFEVIMSAYQRRSDSAALTSATSIAAAIQPTAAAVPRAAAPATGGGASTTVVVPQTTTTPAGGSTGSSQPAAAQHVAIPTVSAPLGFVNAGTLIGSASPDLTPNVLANVALANAGSEKGIGLEPNVALDEQSDYIHHLNELRRINAGDDASDLPGYGLYLVRIPISLLPSRESSRGKGASVTLKAKHNVTPDALQNTFSNVVILDTTYSLLDTIVRGQFFRITDPPEPGPALGPSAVGSGRPPAVGRRPSSAMGSP